MKMNPWHRNGKYQTFFSHRNRVFVKRNAAQLDSTCTETSREARPLAQMVMFNVQLKIRLLPKVPGTSCAAKQLLLVAVLHCQMHLDVRPEKQTLEQINFASFGIRVCKRSHSTTSHVSFTCIDTLESKTSWQRVQWYKTNVCMSSRCFCRSSTDENCLSQLSHTYWVDVVV